LEERKKDSLTFQNLKCVALLGSFTILFLFNSLDCHHLPFFEHFTVEKTFGNPNFSNIGYYG
jgi:hypothetical protein